MKALWYITKRGMANRVRKALRKPVTYLYLVLGIFYVVILGAGLGSMIKDAKFDSYYGLYVILAIMIFYFIPMNFVAYMKKKGIIFTPAHTHFVFPAPVEPKKVLLYMSIKNFLMTFVLFFLLSIIGVIGFQVPFGKMLLIFLTGSVSNFLLEGSLIIGIYGKENLDDKKSKILTGILGMILALLVVFIIWYIRKNGFTIASMKQILEQKALLMIPLLGWNLAVYRLILFGAETVTIICAALYMIVVVTAVILAYKMKCSGGYYEEAAKFADDYVEFRSKKKKGEVALTIGKRKFRKTSGHIKGSKASAILYRQLCEYQKERFFIFGYVTVINAIVAGIMIYVNQELEGMHPGLFLLGIAAYAVLLTSGYLGKWGKELKNPYIYLIPDKPWKKMWYATMMDHIRALVDGSVLVIPIGVMWKVPVWQMIAVILIYVALQANKMYLKIFADSILGDTLGKLGKDIMRVVIQGSTLGIGVLLAVLAGIFIHVNWVFPIILFYCVIITVLIAMIASVRFEVLEQQD